MSMNYTDREKKKKKRSYRGLSASYLNYTDRGRTVPMKHKINHPVWEILIFASLLTALVMMIDTLATSVTSLGVNTVTIFGRTYHIHHSLIGVITIISGLFWLYKTHEHKWAAWFILICGVVIYADAALIWGNWMTFIS